MEIAEGSLVKIRIPEDWDEEFEEYEDPLFFGDIPEDYSLFGKWMNGEFVEVVRIGDYDPHTPDYIGIKCPEDHRGFWWVKDTDIVEVEQVINEEDLWE